MQLLIYRFTEEYFEQPHRGYGGSVCEVFPKLREQRYASPFGPASEQFGGSGSYGNGGAMRISPASLFAYNHTLSQLMVRSRCFTWCTGCEYT